MQTNRFKRKKEKKYNTMQIFNQLCVLDHVNHQPCISNKMQHVAVVLELFFTRCPCMLHKST